MPEFPQSLEEFLSQPSPLELIDLVRDDDAWCAALCDDPPTTPLTHPVISTFDTSKSMPLARALELLQEEDAPPPKIIERYANWAVTDYGVECLGHSYPIEADRLWEGDWIRHIGTKTWCKGECFAGLVAAIARGRIIYAKLEPDWHKERNKKA